MSQIYEQIQELALKAHKVLVISHRRPDPDTLGSALAIKLWLESLKKEVTVACVDKPSGVFYFLPGIKDYVDNFVLEDFDLVIFVDVGAKNMSNFHLQYPEIFDCEIPIINIDHHASNENYGTVNLVDTKAPSATILVYRLFEYLNVEITKEIATCIFTGISSDTGSFMHSNTNEEALTVASKMSMKGIDVPLINKILFKTKSPETLKLWGKILERASITDNGTIVSVVKNSDYEDNIASGESLSGVIDYLNMVPQTRFALLLAEDRKGNVKGSLRTRRNDVNLEEVAKKFGGGGHPKASGFCLPGKIEEAINYKIISGEEKIYKDF